MGDMEDPKQRMPHVDYKMLGVEGGRHAGEARRPLEKATARVQREMLVTYSREYMQFFSSY